MIRLASLAPDTRGATVVEFAFVIPVMMVLLMGLGELTYRAYAQSILTGSLQKAARDSGIEGGAASTDAIDEKVKVMVRKIAPDATFVSTRKNYDTFTAVAPEPFTDTNGNGIRDAGECFTDINGNKTWDADPGTSGQGGASEVTLYTMTVTYPRLFPVAKLLGWSGNGTLTATTLLKNQPYASQVTTTATTVCT